MIWKDEIYYPMIHETDKEKSILCYSRDQSMLKKIWGMMQIQEMSDFFIKKEEEGKEDSIRVCMEEIQKMKLDELQNQCKEMGISIEKISEKTGKSIKKTKNELMDEIKKYSI
jgi:predicted HTH domain antitoxin